TPSLHDALPIFHDEHALAREDEEVLLRVLAVVHRHRLARLHHVEVDPDLPESPELPLEVAVGAELAVEPGGVLRVEDEPAVPLRDEASVLALDQPDLRHARILE